jgi:hypothetical protein
MVNRLVMLAGVSLWLITALGLTSSAQVPLASAAAEASSHAPKDVVDRYCLTCHSSRVRAGNLVLDGLDYDRIPRDSEIWEKVLVKLRTGAMPPAGVPRPDRATYDRVIAELESTIDAAAGAVPDPGRTLLHRMNRAEYQNAVRDLLALDVDVTPLLPPDDSSYGFDNIADILGVSPALQERYLSAADKISALAVGVPEVGIPLDITYQVPADRTQRQHIEGLPLGTRGGILITHTVPIDGEYLIRPRLWKTNNSIIRGLTQFDRLEITVDGKRVHLATLGGTEPYMEGAENINDEIHRRLEVRVRLAAGPRRIGVAFVHKTSAQPPDILQPFESSLDPVDAGGVPQVDLVTIRGPLLVSGTGDSPSRRRIFSCRPESPSRERACASAILSRLGRLAYRRPVTNDDVDALMAAFALGRTGGDFDAGIRVALQRMLADPEFVFRVERSPSRAQPGSVHRISDLELASRLSFFLWSSIPDDELLTLASRRQLSDPRQLERQVRRMMADPRSQAIVDNFAGQWLYLRNLRNQNPDRIEFPDFDDNLRQAFKRETEMLFESVMRQDRSVLELMTADYTFVNERLARHYGIPNIYGSHFRRIALTDERRKGLLGKGSLLLVTSRAERTSPVLRGKWILENLLGTAPPPAPPDVPPFPEPSGEEPATVRERLELHRANATCASCHKLMDPIGLALENFDAVGAWREREGDAPINASGQLFDGTQVDGPVALREALLSRPENIVHTFAEKLMTYAIGRGVTHRDMPTLRRIVRQSAAQDYRFASIVLAIVNSSPFQMRSVPPAGQTAAKGALR